MRFLGGSRWFRIAVSFIVDRGDVAVVRGAFVLLAFGFATLVDAAGFTLVQVSIFFLFKYRFVY